MRRVRRVLCWLGGHRTRVRPLEFHGLAATSEGRPWVIEAECSCWCGRSRYFEGYPAP